MEFLEQVLPLLIENSTEFLIKLVTAGVIFFVGFKVAKAVQRFMNRLMSRQALDPTLIRFTANAIEIAILVLVAIPALGQLGVQTTSLIAVLGSAGLAIGLALQGSLSNLAGGVLIIFFRYFRVGDYISCSGSEGIVEEIQLFTTMLRTPDHRTIIMPNSKLSSETIVNFSLKPERRVDTLVRVGYGENIGQLKELILAELEKTPGVLPDQPHTISVVNLAQGYMELTVNVWVKTSEYMPMAAAIKQMLKELFDREGIKIPVPQQIVHMMDPRPDL